MFPFETHLQSGQCLCQMHRWNRRHFIKFLRLRPPSSVKHRSSSASQWHGASWSFCESWDRCEIDFLGAHRQTFTNNLTISGYICWKWIPLLSHQVGKGRKLFQWQRSVGSFYWVWSILIDSGKTAVNSLLINLPDPDLGWYILTESTIPRKRMQKYPVPPPPTDVLSLLCGFR